MNTKRLVIAAALCLALGAFAEAMAADDPVKVAPKNFKVLLENDQVRVLEYHSKAGEKIAMHSHPNYIVYALNDGKTKFTMPDGSTRMLELKKGEARWADAVTHSQETITDTDGIVIELKQPMAKK